MPAVEDRYESELAHSTQVLNDVDRALERLSEGSYGSCERCGDPLAEADLVADPTRRVCPQHEVGSTLPATLGISAGDGQPLGGGEPSGDIGPVDNVP